MIIEFIKLRLRESTRSSVWNKNVVINIILALFMLYMMVCFFILGFVLDRALMKAFPGYDPVEILNRVLLYYFAFELFVRFLMQQTPAISITPFLHLPVKRSSLMHLLLARSAIVPLNYISFVIFIPFAIRAVAVIYSGAAACWWLMTLFLSMMFVTYLNVYIKRQMVVKPFVALGCGLAFIALIVSDVMGVLSLSKFSSALFGAVLEHPLWVLAPLVLAAGAYLLNYRFLMINSYPEEIDRTVRKKQAAAVQTFGFMSRFGQIGELIGLELKLILRHKRTKAIFYIVPLILLYGFIFYPNPVYKNSIMWLMLVGIFLSGFMMLAYGNFLVAWEGKFFDGILTRRGSLFDYFRAKYYLLVSFCIICYIITMPYVYFGTRILFIQTVCFLFNVGVSACITIWFAQFNRKRIDLSQGSAFNWQGTGGAQFLFMLPVLLLPIIIAAIFNWIGIGDWGLGVLAFLGVTGVLCHKWIIKWICKGYAQAKYAQAEGFRGN